jgi:hypothetical protein
LQLYNKYYTIAWMKRICKKCNLEKNIEEFAIAKTTPKKVFRRRLCGKCYYQTKKPRKNKIKNEFFEFKKTLKCLICGNNDFRVLDFDHIDPSKKSFNIGKQASQGIAFKSIMKEIDKCQVLCANCHRIKTWEDRQNR